MPKINSGSCSNINTAWYSYICLCFSASFCEVSMEGFFEKYQQLLLRNSTGSKNGECVLNTGLLLSLIFCNIGIEDYRAKIQSS